MGTSSSTIELLNEADRLERIMRWQEFQRENDAVLYGGGEDEWKPGEPLVNRRTASTDAQRPMVQIYFWSESEDHSYSAPEVYTDDAINVHSRSVMDRYGIRCFDCEVGWPLWMVGVECWICGVVPEPERDGPRVETEPEAPAAFSSRLTYDEFMLYRPLHSSFLDQLFDGIRTVNDIAYQVEERLWLGMNSRVVFYDELTPELYVPPTNPLTRGDVSTPEFDLFPALASEFHISQEPVVGPPSGFWRALTSVPALPPRVRLPSSWRELANRADLWDIRGKLDLGYIREAIRSSTHGNFPGRNMVTEQRRSR